PARARRPVLPLRLQQALGSPLAAHVLRGRPRRRVRRLSDGSRAGAPHGPGGQVAEGDPQGRGRPLPAMTPLRAVGLLLLIVAIVAVALSRHEERQRTRMTDRAAAQRELAATRLAPSGSAPQAGISARA